MKFNLKINSKKILADTITPVSIYLNLRDKFPTCILLECSDYHGDDNSYSFICCKPIAGIKAENEILTSCFPDGTKTKLKIGKHVSICEEMEKFLEQFEIDGSHQLPKEMSAGLYGYMNYDAVRYFEDVELNARKDEGKRIPDLHYGLYQFVIAIDHLKNEGTIIEYVYGEREKSEIALLEATIAKNNFVTHKFKTKESEASNFSDLDFVNVIKEAKVHCKLGDVFQMVVSREFSRKFNGDEFNVYRALRSINPSPYLFYFDYGNFKLFGSSPEAQLKVKAAVATVNTIAGTFRRTGNDIEDLALAEKLKDDRKENAEHIMLVDLARNDLSRNCVKVEVKNFKEVQLYSHVIHLVSSVSGNLKPGRSLFKLVADAFPAGTLSGAPKHRAMQLIDRYENGSRSFYGGCIGFLGFDGTFNSAIMIRSFLSKNNCLFYQAGAGVVENSVEEKELQEVNNKLGALKSALELANEY